MEKHQVLKGSSINWEKQQEQGLGAEARHIQSGEKTCRSFPGRMRQEQALIKIINSLTLNYLKISLLYKLCPRSSVVPPTTLLPGAAPEHCQSILSSPTGLAESCSCSSWPPTSSRSPFMPGSGHSFQGQVDFPWNLKYWVTKCLSSNDLGEHQNPL